MKPFRLPLICLLFALQNPPAAHSGEPPAAVERIAAFGRDLAAKRGPGTYVDCPLSTYRALAMLWAGAKNATADQIALVLKDPGGRDLWADLEAWQEMRRDLSGGTLPVAAQERLWIQAEYPVEAGYADFLGQRGLEAPGSVDFISDPEKAREQINRWAAAATRNQVPSLFPGGAFSGNTRVVLAGTVYFQGRWEEAFDPEQTRTESFRGRSGPAPVPLMHRKGRMVYAEDHGWQIVGLPFDDQGTQLVVALPPEDSPELADRLGAGDPIDAWTAAGQEREVDLFLPRFSISSSLDLSAWLAELGMPDAFSRDRADFSGLNPELYLSGVYQGVSIVVDESGVEAAAGAGAVMDMKGAFAPALPPVVFRADRPFFFCVRDALSGLVYFSGCLADAAPAPRPAGH